MFTVKGGLDLGWSGVAEFAAEALFVEPFDPPGRGDLDVIEASPGSGAPPTRAVAGQDRAHAEALTNCDSVGTCR